MKVSYSSNNSGGSWWLTDENWKALEKAGWTVKWYRDERLRLITEALEEFENVTGQHVTDEGCNCCGPPHSFDWSTLGCCDDTCNCKGPHADYNYASGEDLLPYLYPGRTIPKSLREAVEKEGI